MERKRLLLFAIIQILPLLILPPSWFSVGAIALIVVMVAIFAFLGWGLMRGKGWALTMSIFMQGMNVIVRLMMMFPNAVDQQGVWNVPLIILFLIAIGLSFWMAARLDRPDVRSLMVS